MIARIIKIRNLRGTTLSKAVVPLRHFTVKTKADTEDLTLAAIMICL